MSGWIRLRSYLVQGVRWRIAALWARMIHAFLALLGHSPAVIQRLALKLDRKFIRYCDDSFETVLDDYFGKYRVRICSKYFIEQHMYIGDYETGHLALMGRLLSPGDTVLDVGANVGAIAIPLADMVGANGSVHAFEPGPVNFARLKRNIEDNPSIARIVRLNQLGMADKPGELVWYEFAHMPGNAGFHAPDGSWMASQEVTVPVTTVDLYVKSHGLTSVAFIKIDTEGYEYNVLRGASDTLERLRPILTVETLSEYKEMSGRAYFARIMNLMNGLGYELFRVESGILRPATEDAFAQDTVCLPREKVGTILSGRGLDGRL